MSLSQAAPEREVIYILDPPKPPSNGLGTAGFVVSILGIFTFGLLSPLGLLLSFLGIWKRPRGFASIGLLLGLLGTGFIGSLAVLPAVAHHRHLEAVQQEQRVAATRAAIHAAIENVRVYFDQPDVERIDGIDGNAITVRYQDAWGQDLRFDERDQGFAVRSAGPDGEFDTGDDLVEVVSEVALAATDPRQLAL